MSDPLLTKEAAAAIAGYTVRHMRRLDAGPDAPPWMGNGYHAAKFGQWLKRQWRKELGVAEDGQVYDYDTEKARLTKAQADKTELEAQELRGEMARVSEVVEEWWKQTGAAKARLLSTPAKVAPRARAAESDQAAAKLIEAEIVEALEELSDDGLPERTRTRRARGAGGLETSAAADGERMGGQVSKALAGKRV